MAFTFYSFGSLHEKSSLLHCIEWNTKLQTWVTKHQVWETMGKKTHLSTSVGNTSHEIDDAENTWYLCILLQRSHNYSIAHGLNSHQFIANIKFQHLLYANYHKQNEFTSFLSNFQIFISHFGTKIIRETMKFRHWWIYLQNKTSVSLISLNALQDPREKILDKRLP